MGHADKILRRDAYKISGQNVSACLVETSPRAWCYPAWAEPRSRARPSQRPAPAPLQCNELLPNWSCLTPPPFFLLFVLTAPWKQQERLCAVCSWECTSMDNRAAEIPWCLPLSDQIVPVPTEPGGFCGFGVFFLKFPESAHCIERNTLNWTKNDSCPFISLVLKIWRLSEGKF